MEFSIHARSMILRIKQHDALFEMTFKTPRDCSVMVALLRRTGIHVSNVDGQMRQSALGVNHNLLHEIQPVPRLSDFSSIRQITDPRFIKSRSELWLAPNTTPTPPSRTANESLPFIHRNAHPQLIQPYSASPIDTRPPTRPDYNPYNIFLGRGRSGHINSPLWQSQGYGSPNGEMSDMFPLALPATTYNYLGSQQSQQTQQSSLPATQQVPLPMPVQRESVKSPGHAERPPEPRKLPFRVPPQTGSSTDNTYHPTQKPLVIPQSLDDKERAAFGFENSQRPRRCLRGATQKTTKCNSPKEAAAIEVRLENRKESAPKKGSTPKLAKKHAAPAKPVATNRTGSVQASHRPNPSKTNSTSSVKGNKTRPVAFSALPQRAKNGRFLPKKIKRIRNPETTQQHLGAGTRASERVVLADAAALQQVNLATAALLDQYRLDARDTTSERNLAVYYCDRIAEMRLQAWMDVIACKEPAGIRNSVMRATESLPL